MIDFVGFPGIDGFRVFSYSARNCQKSSRIVKNLKKVIDFVGFPGIDGFR